jgi:hypothetical protein
MGLGMGPVQKLNRGGEGPGTRRRLLFAALALGQQPTGPLALPSKCPIPADLSVTDPTYLIPERDGAPLGERHEALARR